MQASVLRDDLFVIPENVNFSFGETLADPSYFKEGKVGTALRPVSKCLEGKCHILIFFWADGEGGEEGMLGWVGFKISRKE